MKEIKRDILDKNGKKIGEYLYRSDEKKTYFKDGKEYDYNQLSNAEKEEFNSLMGEFDPQWDEIFDRLESLDRNFSLYSFPRFGLGSVIEKRFKRFDELMDQMEKRMSALENKTEKELNKPEEKK